MIRRVVAALGRTLIAVGVLLLLFVVYQPWGTGIAHARDQRRLTRDATASLTAAGIDVDDFDRIVAGNATVTTEPNAPPSGTAGRSRPTTRTPTTLTPTTRTPTTRTPTALTPTTRTPTTLTPTTAAPPTTVFHSKRPMQTPKPGHQVGLIRIPTIGVKETLVEGTGVDDLKSGPGHYVGTPYPGQSGNAAIAGHRTTYGAPFYRLDELKPGDPIYVATPQGIFRYDVLGLEVVKPTDTSVLASHPGVDTLTLTTCTPRFSASRRLIVTARLAGTAVEADLLRAPGQPAVVPTTSAPASTAPASTAPASTATASTAPASTAPGSTAPGSTATASTAPASTAPASTAPASTRSVPTAPASTITATAGPRSTGPGGDRIGSAPERKYALGDWLSGPRDVWTQTLLWAGICAIVWLGAWLVARRRPRTLGRWGVYAAALVVFLPALYVCYENLARLLPENV